MSPRPLWLEKDDLPRPASPILDPSRTTRTTSRARALQPTDGMASRLRRISIGLEAARQSERDAQRALIEAQRSSLRVAERTIAILQDQIRHSEQRALTALRNRLRTLDTSHDPSPSVPAATFTREDDGDDDGPDESSPSPAPATTAGLIEPATSSTERLKAVDLTPEELLENGSVDADGVEREPIHVRLDAVSWTVGR